MSSNIQVRRICQYCKQEFTARTTVTKCCSDKCSKAAYKARKRADSIDRSNTETIRMKQQSVEQLQAKDYLTVTEVSQLLNCSTKSVYRYIKSDTISAVNLGQRLTRVKRSEIDKLFQQQPTEEPEPIEYEIEDCITLTEAQERYNVSQTALQQLIKRHSIPKIKKGRYAYVPIQLIKDILT